MVRLVGVCIGLGIALAPIGCRRGAPSAERTGAGPAASEAASDLGAAQAAPDGLPRELPVYPGAVAVEANQAHGSGASLVLESLETPQKVAAFYKSRLLAGGWSLDGEMSVEGEYVLVASKQERRASALVADQAGRTRITLTVSRAD